MHGLFLHQKKYHRHLFEDSPVLLQPSTAQNAHARVQVDDFIYYHVLLCRLVRGKSYTVCDAIVRDVKTSKGCSFKPSPTLMVDRPLIGLRKKNVLLIHASIVWWGDFVFRGINLTAISLTPAHDDDTIFFHRHA
eukprot:scaffold34603_cov212-Amphora_coffeaeformis.AAC.4